MCVTTSRPAARAMKRFGGLRANSTYCTSLSLRNCKPTCSSSAFFHSARKFPLSRSAMYGRRLGATEARKAHRSRSDAAEGSMPSSLARSFRRPIRALTGCRASVGGPGDWAWMSGARASRAGSWATAYWQQPHRWDAQAAHAGTRARVFCASMAGVFEWKKGLSSWQVSALGNHRSHAAPRLAPAHQTTTLGQSPRALGGRVAGERVAGCHGGDAAVGQQAPAPPCRRAGSVRFLSLRTSSGEGQTRRVAGAQGHPLGDRRRRERPSGATQRPQLVLRHPRPMPRPTTRPSTSNNGVIGRLSMLWPALCQGRSLMAVRTPRRWAGLARRLRAAFWAVALGTDCPSLETDSDAPFGESTATLRGEVPFSDARGGRCG